MPPFASFKMSTICDSLNLDFRMTTPCREQSTYEL
jgi:hypothetical protein